MAKISTDQLIDAFKELTLIELSEFVSQFEEVFNVTAAAPVAMAAAPAAGGGDGGGATADQDEFDVILEDGGALMFTANVGFLLGGPGTASDAD